MWSWVNLTFPWPLRAQLNITNGDHRTKVVCLDQFGRVEIIILQKLFEIIILFATWWRTAKTRNFYHISIGIVGSNESFADLTAFLCLRVSFKKTQLGNFWLELLPINGSDLLGADRGGYDSKGISENGLQLSSERTERVSESESRRETGRERHWIRPSKRGNVWVKFIELLNAVILGNAVIPPTTNHRYARVNFFWEHMTAD